ncbi:MAG: para-aminobenzoate synthetase component [Pseudomonadota bacterium]|jgi:para-aminobenzoate synthetase component 1
MTQSSPHCTSVPYPVDSQDYAQLYVGWDGFIWLDSGTRREYCSEIDIITARPSHTLTAYTEDHIELTKGRYKHRLNRVQALQWCEQQLDSRASSSNTLPFNGGLLGYVGYEWMHADFKLPCKMELQTPLLFLGVYEWALIIDHIKKTAYFIFTDQLPIELRAEIFDKFNASPEMPGHFTCSTFTPLTDKSRYINDVQTILNYIHAGDCYQANYSQAFKADFLGDAFVAYCHLRQGCPGPFSAFIKTTQGAVLSLSPEQFIETDGQQVHSRPIKGTSARGVTLQEDTEAKEILQQSIKNRAENLMIVDLLRNDLSKNCKPGSVKVAQLFGLYSFTNVHHLISHIHGMLSSNVSSWKLFSDAFPGGSITGAPKKRAMEIIHEIEQHPRHIYCGSIGFWSRNGKSRTNIAIRTLLVEDQQIIIWGGGGVVADSNPEDEYAESLNKIEVFKNILTAENKDSA